MNLRIKFNLVIIVSCLISALIAYKLYSASLHEYKNKNMMDKAQFILDLSTSLKTYNNTQVKPLLLENSQQGFVKQSVSAYALSQVFSNITTTTTGLTKFKIVFKDTQVELYQGNTWENEIVGFFIKNSLLEKYSINKSDESGTFLILAVPLIENNAVIGAKIISVYDALYDDVFNKQLKEFFIILLIAVLVLLLVFNLFFHLFFFKPMKYMLKSCKEISYGTSSVELPIHSNDELSQIADAFNRMQRSLKAAMAMMSK